MAVPFGEDFAGDFWAAVEERVVRPFAMGAGREEEEGYSSSRKATASVSMAPRRFSSLKAGITTERKREGGSGVGFVVVSPLRRSASFSATYLSYQHGNWLFLLIFPLPSIQLYVFSDGRAGRGVGAAK